MTVNKDHQSYLTPDAEHMFGSEDKNGNKSKSGNQSNDDELSNLFADLDAELEKVVKEEIRKTIEKKMYKVLSIFAHEVEREYIERKREEKKNRWIVIGVSFAGLIIVTFLFEYFFTPKYITTAIFGFVVSLIAFIGESHSRIGQEIAHIRDNKETITTGIVNVVKALAQMAKKASLLHLFVLLSGIFLLGEFLGSVGVIGGTYKFASAVYIVAKSGVENVLVESNVDEKNPEVIMAECDEKTINMLQQAVITQAELYAAIQLSQQDYDLVFYLNRENIDWTDQGQVNDAVLQMINERLSMQIDNVFDKSVNDGGAPQWLRDSVYQASENEKTADSFSKIKDVRDVRADAYGQYPKKSLANLLSNDYQKMAIILYINGGEEDAIIYYYSQSVLWDFECLQFVENSDATVKDKLISIAQRYRDMIYTCPNMENIENTKALAEAFENVAKQF